MNLKKITIDLAKNALQNLRGQKPAVSGSLKNAKPFDFLTR